MQTALPILWKQNKQKEQVKPTWSEADNDWFYSSQYFLVFYQSGRRRIKNKEYCLWIKHRGNLGQE